MGKRNNTPERINIAASGFPVPTGALPITGDLVFTRQGDVTTPNYTKTGKAVVAGEVFMCVESMIGAQPAGWVSVFLNCQLNNAGANPVENLTTSPMTMKKLAAFNGVAGAVKVATASFGAVTPAVAQPGEFVISDPCATALPDEGTVLRWIVEATAGLTRPAGYAPNFHTAGVRGRLSSLESTFDPAFVGGVLNNGSANFNLDMPQLAAVLAPKAVGFQSILLLGTSLTYGVDTNSRYNLGEESNTFAFLPIGLNNTTSGRMGWGMFASPGSRIGQLGEFAGFGNFFYRYRLLKFLRDQNSGRWPMTRVMVDLRNDIAAVGDRLILEGTEYERILAKMKQVVLKEVSRIKYLFPGLPVDMMTIPPMRVSSSNNGFYVTLAGQTAQLLPSFADVLVELNTWILANKALIGVSLVCDIAADVGQVDGGLLKWKPTPFSAAGGGTILVENYPTGLPAGFNITTTGIIVDCPNGQIPEVGNYGTLEHGNAANGERISTAAQIASVSLVSGTRYLVKFSSGTLVKAHPAGSVFMTGTTSDGTHFSKWLHKTIGLNSVLAYKAAIVA